MQCTYAMYIHVHVYLFRPVFSVTNINLYGVLRVQVTKHGISSNEREREREREGGEGEGGIKFALLSFEVFSKR